MSEVMGPTYPEVSDRLRLKEQRVAHTAAVVAAWRRKNPWAPCNDATALILAELERDFGGAALRAEKQEAR